MPALESQSPKNLVPRPHPAWALAKVLGWLALVCLVLYLAFGLWVFVMFWQEQRVSLTVINHAAMPAGVSLLEVKGPAGGTAPLIAVDVVGSGRNWESSAETGRDVGWSVVRVLVGGTTYEGAGATLLDHHGPHRYTVEVYADKVAVIHQSSRRTDRFDLRPVLPTSPATTQGTRARQSSASE
jgi:hypothetical protein